MGRRHEAERLLQVRHCAVKGVEVLVAQDGRVTQVPPAAALLVRAAVACTGTKQVSALVMLIRW